jgi:hypothetical protein
MTQTSNTTQGLVLRIKNANHIPIVAIGWFLGLLLAALFLPLGDLGLRPASGVIRGVLVILAVWTTYTIVAVPLYFFRAWLKIRTVTNRTEYVLWLGFETLCAFALTWGIVYYVLLHH